MTGGMWRGLAIALIAAAALCGGPARARAAAPPSPPIHVDAEDLADQIVARLAERQGDYAEAAARHARRMDRAPSDPGRVDAAVRAALAAGDGQAALAAAETGARNAASPTLSPQLTRAAERLRRGRWRDARDLAAAAARNQGEQGMRLAAAVVEAWALQAGGRREEAFAALARIPRPRAFAATLSYQRAMMHEQSRRAQDAQAAYAEAAAQPRALPAEAIRYAAFLRRQDREADARTLQAEWALRTDVIAIPGAAWRTPAEGAPGAAAIALQSLSQMVADQGDLDQALRLLTLSLLLDPQADLSRMAMARLLEDARHPQAAIANLNAIAPSSAYFPDAQMRIAHIRFAAGEADAAVAAAYALSGAAPGVQSQLALGELLLDAGRAQDALSAFAAAAQNAPNEWRPVYGLGRAYLALGDWPAAEPRLRQALERAPDNPDLLNSLGMALVEQGGRVQEGQALIERALSLRPNAGPILNSLGWVLFLQGRYDEAASHLELALRRAPADPQVLDRLGDAYWRVGRRTEARYQWRRAGQLEQDPARRASIQDKLANGLPQEQA